MKETALTTEYQWRTPCASQDSVPQTVTLFAGLMRAGLRGGCPARITYQPGIFGFSGSRVESERRATQYFTSASNERNRLSGGSLRTSCFVGEATAFRAAQRDLRAQSVIDLASFAVGVTEVEFSQVAM